MIFAVWGVLCSAQICPPGFWCNRDESLARNSRKNGETFANFYRNKLRRIFNENQASKKEVEGDSLVDDLWTDLGDSA